MSARGFRVLSAKAGVPLLGVGTRLAHVPGEPSGYAIFAELS
jgi:hypothetical protein